MTDYFEEKVVNRVLSWRMKPDGVWNPYSAEVLTCKLVEASIAIQELYKNDIKILTDEESEKLEKSLYGFLSYAAIGDKNGA